MIRSERVKQKMNLFIGIMEIYRENLTKVKNKIKVCISLT